MTFNQPKAMPRCSTVPELEVPPGIVPSGSYIVVVDINGDSKMLARITGRGILYFDGDQSFLAGGSDDDPIILPDIPILANNSVFGFLSLTNNGRIVGSVNGGEVEMTLRSKLGQTYWAAEAEGGEDDDFMVPNDPDGFGILIRQPDASQPAFFGLPGLIYIQNDKTVTQLPLGNEGQILKIIGGIPVFATPSSGNVSAGSGLSSLDGVQAKNASAATVTLTAPKLILSDGSTEVTVSNVNVTVNLAAANGLLGLDVGAEASNRWYYIYVLSDGALVSAVISEDDTAPDPTNLAAYTFYALAGVFRNDSSGNIIPFSQKGRDFWTTPVNMCDNVSISTSLAAIPQTVAMTSILPPFVKVAKGIAGGSATAASPTSIAMEISADGSSLGATLLGGSEYAIQALGFKKDVGMFELPILDPLAPSLYWRGNAPENHRRVSFIGYRI